MTSFQSLENHSYFVSKKEKRECLTYLFETEIASVREIGVIHIPRELGGKIEWEYKGIRDKKGSMAFFFADYLSKEIPRHGNWFCDLITQSKALLEKRDKIRNIFERKI